MDIVPSLRLGKGGLATRDRITDRALAWAAICYAHTSPLDCDDKAFRLDVESPYGLHWSTSSSIQAVTVTAAINRAADNTPAAYGQRRWLRLGPSDAQRPSDKRSTPSATKGTAYCTAREQWDPPLPLPPRRSA
ncbi:hypothetical protein AC579_3012 [Pseudocercospora musae]|uniref:Uncharacterized protein n=1 Tax=Pseudocercospora musae TaxID=113226 RepID=A0A139I4L6_9PEZI|nr:hypothetical protein AC579_3012 [Pseudocercospora musae]